jgi:hypothetical protein
VKRLESSESHERLQFSPGTQNKRKHASIAPEEKDAKSVYQIWQGVYEEKQQADRLSEMLRASF